MQNIYKLMALRSLWDLSPEKWVLISAFIAMGVFLIWVISALVARSSFYKKCDRANKYINANNINASNSYLFDDYAKKISKGFYNGFNNYKEAKSGKPSEFISKENAFDDKSNYKFFLYNTSTMTVFLIISFIAILVFSIIKNNNGSGISFGGVSLISLAVPAIYLLVVIIMFFVYVLLSLNFYSLAVDSLSELLENMDKNMSKAVDETSEPDTLISEKEESKIDSVSSNNFENDNSKMDNENSENSENGTANEEISVDEYEKDILNATSEEDVEAIIDSVAQNSVNSNLYENKSELDNENQVADGDLDSETEFDDEKSNNEIDSDAINEDELEDGLDMDEFISLLVELDRIDQEENEESKVDKSLVEESNTENDRAEDVEKEDFTYESEDEKNNDDDLQNKIENENNIEENLKKLNTNLENAPNEQLADNHESEKQDETDNLSSNAYDNAYEEKEFDELIEEHSDKEENEEFEQDTYDIDKDNEESFTDIYTDNYEENYEENSSEESSNESEEPNQERDIIKDEIEETDFDDKVEPEHEIQEEISEENNEHTSESEENQITEDNDTENLESAETIIHNEALPEIQENKTINQDNQNQSIEDEDDYGDEIIEETINLEDDYNTYKPSRVQEEPVRYENQNREQKRQSNNYNPISFIDVDVKFNRNEDLANESKKDDKEDNTDDNKEEKVSLEDTDNLSNENQQVKNMDNTENKLENDNEEFDNQTVASEEPVDSEKSEDDEIADLVGQFKTIQQNSEDNYIPENVLDEEDDMAENNIDDDENLDDIDDDYYVDDYDDRNDDETDETDEELDNLDDDVDYYVDDYDEEDFVSDSESEDNYKSESVEDSLNDLEMNKNDVIADDYENNGSNQTQNQSYFTNPYYNQGQYMPQNPYANMYYPPIIGYDQNGYPIYQNMGYGYNPMYGMQNPYANMGYSPQYPNGYQPQGNNGNFNNTNANLSQNNPSQVQNSNASNENYFDKNFETDTSENLKESHEPQAADLSTKYEKPVKERKKQTQQKVEIAKENNHIKSTKKKEEKKEDNVSNVANKQTEFKPTLKTEKEEVKEKKEANKAKTNQAKKQKTDLSSEKTKSGRGRPKSKSYNEPFEIQNDEEFDEVLATANKLMRKSEGNLSETQAKKVEKELAILMEAMSNYKNKEE